MKGKPRTAVTGCLAFSPRNGEIDRPRLLRRFCAHHMIPGLTNELLARLIGIGRREAFDQLPQLLTDFPEARSGQLMRQPLQEWYELARRHSREEVTALIKVLTVAERDLPAFCGGSVSPVIALYRYLLESAQDDFTWLRDWVVAHTQNQYLPFGSGRYRPTSMSDYHRQVTEHETLSARARAGGGSGGVCPLSRTK